MHDSFLILNCFVAIIGEEAGSIIVTDPLSEIQSFITISFQNQNEKE